MYFWAESTTTTVHAVHINIRYHRCAFTGVHKGLKSKRYGKFEPPRLLDSFRARTRTAEIRSNQYWAIRLRRLRRKKQDFSFLLKNLISGSHLVVCTWCPRNVVALAVCESRSSRTRTGASRKMDLIRDLRTTGMAPRRTDSQVRKQSSPYPSVSRKIGNIKKYFSLIAYLAGTAQTCFARAPPRMPPARPPPAPPCTPGRCRCL